FSSARRTERVVEPMKRLAIGLLSGGLDSSLALHVIKEQGVEIVALHFVTPFCQCSPKGCGSEAVGAARRLGIELKSEHLGEEYLALVRKPPHGYGSNMNPCIDCRILMFTRARELMETLGASFVFTGEVLGERPMSQRRDSMRVIEKESGLVGRLLRPLSAKLMVPTKVEEDGTIDRERLLALSGRSRKPQMSLAREYGINDYPCPAGGCLLTDPCFAKRVKDLVEHDTLTMDNAKLLRTGRHFRLSDTSKLIVGRNEAENRQLESVAREGDVVLTMFPIPGPVALLRDGDKRCLEISAGICAAHSDARQEREVPVAWRDLGAGDTGVLNVAPMEHARLEPHRIA
ncbi:MAG: hypothetical protein V2A71_06680, partial [Candidatus Eisenbacteria bacterium]